MRNVFISTAVILSLLMIGCQKSNNLNYIFATGGTSGTYYSFGGSIASIWNANIEGMNVTAQSTGASAENLRLLNRHEADLAFVQNDVMDYAYNGTDIFDGEVLSNFSAVLTLYPELVQIAATKSSGITSIADMKGKRVSVGDAGSGTEFNAKQILEAYGLTFDDINKSNLSFKESSDGLQNGSLDACFIVAGIPNAALQELSLSSDIVLVSLDKAQVDEILNKYKYYTEVTIPANTYNNVTTDTTAIAVRATITVNNDIPEDVVYNLIKTLFDKKADLATAHAKGEELNIEDAYKGVSIPFHPGALKYYKELGYNIQ
ncbi:TAXI family TRAP transporter solute-binding subunit [Brachyspira hampsonii]|uniref:C4-dicarboxylate ABC transporter substrate-binding protein n=1 Tax=Brachyspira hampsonii TaxID=1287055 RepID=A0AAC9TS01_9SPIR|nr:TAXI family TRAP transporter solute-binding subunit [Brachyspira hampsonii]ASJ20883.1 C4-dicarboxylate ABC transporter substrate-binding protein [Brachyspira hampsonii]ELV06409.1 TRAP transporter solute receptor, TAXI family protein [Brachyspira hampsonii 30599]MBW5380103.1 TAXI family TRAP transporter solute-binding subunit [Brachyspira hampsonii]MBW5409867.1 TAXI family TRAP transporter solute-binding subunit [Brachyspira hampsonii]OEJ18918.1 C4-dicarboxylate ABC transporter substrate-bin